ncbi:MAG: hypothetical protein NT045_07355 [Candidatus Aureabacteria bacterium]|nr:hypothetical protein [Candidatus Auribacterota bacterium]
METWEVTPQTSVYGALIPREIARDSTLIIRFDLPDSKSPLELNTGIEYRRLGVGVRTIVLSEQGHP